MIQLDLIDDDVDDEAVTARMPGTVESRKPRGFAAMDREQVRAIASKGGRAAHAMGTAHRWTPEEASRAGRKGGAAPHARRGGPRKHVA